MAPTATPESTTTSSHTPSQHRIEWQYEPSDEELIEAQLVHPDVDGKPLLGPLGAKAIASVTGAVSTSLLMTPFDVLKTRLQTVRPSQTIVPSPFISMPETICCQTAVIRSAKAGPGPSSLRQMASSNMSPQGTTANATCLTANMKASPQSVQLPARFVPAFAASSSTQATSMAIPPAPEGCLHPSKWAGIWGELITNEEAERLRSGGTTTTSSLSELSDQARKGAKELTKRIVSTSAAEGGFWNEIRVILAEPAGWRGLWKGVGTGLIMSIPSASIYMLGYEYLLAGLNGKSMTLASTPRSRNNTDNRATIISQHTPLDHTPTSQSDLPAAATQQAYLSPAPFLAGSMARTISATVISPIELFRTRLQALPAPGQIPPSYASTFSSINLMVKEQGVRALWRGLGPTLWRDVPFSGLYWAGFESFKRYFTESQIIQPGISLTFTSGALSGTLASLVTSPFDVLKTRRQVFTPSKNCSPAALAHPASTLPLLSHIVKTEGWQALFAGVVPRTAKVAPACGMMIAAYEGVGRLLN